LNNSSSTAFVVHHAVHKEGFNAAIALGQVWVLFVWMVSLALCCRVDVMDSAAMIRIAMWSGPLNISTAMMRSWGSRADTL